MRIFVTGVSGLLGLNTALTLRDRVAVSGGFFRHPITAAGITAVPLDVTDAQSVYAAFDRCRPEVVVHTAGLTSVDQCEDEPTLAERLNVDASRIVASAAARAGVALVHVSTDHLFEGTLPNRSENDLPAPVNVYGRTKLRAEHAVLTELPDALVIRTNFYGWGPPGRQSLSDWILSGLQSGQELPMFEDVFFTPILVNDLAERLLDLIRLGASGVLHLAGGERLSKLDFAGRVAQEFGLSSSQIKRRSVDQHPFRAVRPKDLSLDCSRAAGLLGAPLPDAATGVRRLRELRQNGWPSLIADASRHP